MGEFEYMTQEERESHGDDLHPSLQEVPPLPVQEADQVPLHLLQLLLLPPPGPQLGPGLPQDLGCGDHSVQGEGGRPRH